MSDAQHALSAGTEGGGLCRHLEGWWKMLLMGWEEKTRISGLGLGVGAVSAAVIDTHLCLVILNV